MHSGHTYDGHACLYSHYIMAPTKGRAGSARYVKHVGVTEQPQGANLDPQLIQLVSDALIHGCFYKLGSLLWVSL